MRLTFVEPKAAPGTRRFQVIANGQPALRDFDVAEAAGGTLIEVRRSFEAVASDKGLDLHFKPGSGSALVSGVEVTPLP